MRLFVSVPVPDPVREALEVETRGLKSALRGGRWPPPRQWHFTLKFLGDVGEEKTGKLMETLRGAALAAEPFNICVGGLGFFPSAREERTLWAGVTAGGGDMERLAAGLEDRLAAAGFARETRPFHAHLTLGRFKSLSRPALFAAAQKTYGSFRVEAIELVESFLESRGARHRRVESFALGGGR